MKVVILEDEVRTARHLENLLKKIDDSIVVDAIIPSVIAAANWFSNHPAPDLVLMDIHLEDELVFSLFSKVKIRVPVIFTTAYDQYMLQAFKVSGIDYLLKPVQSDELAAALQKFRSLQEHFVAADYDRLLQVVQNPGTAAYRDRFMIKAGSKMLTVETNEIAYILLISKITYIITHTNKRFIVGFSLDELGSMLDPKKFHRVNRQYIVALDAVMHAQQLKPGQTKLELKPGPGEEVIISADRLPAFKQWLGK